MNRLWSFCFLMLVWLSQLPAVDPTLPKKHKQAPAWGIVFSPAGNSMAAVNIQILPMFNAEGEHLQLSSNVSGELNFTPPKRQHDDYVVWRHPQYATWGRGHINVDRFGPDQLFEIKLKDALPFKGRVLDPKGKGIPGANVSIDADLPCGDHTHIFSDLSSVTSGPDGSFTFKDLPPDNKFRLIATHPKYSMTKRQSFDHKVEKETASSNLILTMNPSQALRIYLLEPDGKSVPQKNLSYGFSENKVDDFGDIDHKTSQFNIQSDDRGMINLRGPKKGFIHLRLDFPSHEERELLNLPLAPWKDQRISLKPKAGLTFQIIDQMSRKPIADASIRVRFKDPKRNYETSERGITNKKGRVTLFIPSTKKATAQAWADGFLATELELKTEAKKVFQIELNQGETSTIALMQPLPHGGSALIPNRAVEIRHSFYPSGKSSRNSRRSRGREYKNIKTKSDEKGELQIKGFEKGDDMTFKVQGYVSKKIKAPTPGDPLDLMLEPGSQLVFRITNEAGTEIERPRFYLKTGGGQNSISSKYLKKTKQHRLDPLPDGSHQILIKEYQHKDESIDIEIGADNPKEFHVVLESKPEISVKLKGLKDPKNPGSVRVQFIDSRGRKQSSRVTRVKDVTPPTYKCQPYQKPDGLREMIVTVSNHLPVTLPVDFEKEKVYEVSLESGLSLSAIISGQDGSPVKDARVTINEKNPWRSHHGNTNEEGKVNIGGLKEGDFRAQVRKKGFAPFALESLEFKKDQPPYQWTLSKGLDLRVNVVDQNGLPLEDIEVKLFSQSDYGGLQQHNIDSNWPTSDESGEVLFSNLTEGHYQVKGSAEEAGLGQSEPFLLKTGENKVVTLTIKEGLKITGTVHDESGNPVEGVGIRAHHMMGNHSGRSNEAESDDNGQFILSNLAEGVYNISLQHSDYEYTEQIQAKAGESDLKFKLKTLQEWRIQVLQPDGQISTKATLHRYVPQWGGLSSMGRTEMDGEEYIITSRQLGGERNKKMEFQIIAKSHGFGPAKSETLTMERMSDLTLRLTPSISRTITVRDLEGNPIENASIRANQVIEGKEIHGSRRSEDFTNEQGVFELEGLSEGDYKIYVEHTDYASKTHEIEVKDPSGTVDISLSRGGSVKGTIVDHELKPKQGVQLWITKSSGQYLNRGESVTKADGTFEITSLAEGSYLLQVSNQKNSWSRDVEVKKPFTITDGQEIEINLQLKAPEPTGSLIGKLKEGTIFQSVTLSGLEHRSGQQHQAVVKKSSFSFKDVPVGKYTLMLMGMKGYTTRKVEIEEGKTTEIDIGDQKTFRVVAKIENSDGSPILTGMAMMLRKKRSRTMNLHGHPDAVAGTGQIQAGVLEMDIEEHGQFDLMVNITGNRRDQTTFLVKDVTILDSEKTDLGILKRPTTYTQKVTVLSPEGIPLQGAYASIYQNGIPVRNNSWVSNSEGVILLDRAPESSFSLVVRHREYATFSEEFSHSNPFEITLTQGYDISLSLPEFPNTKVDLVDHQKKPLLYQLQYFRAMSLLLDSEGNLSWKKMPAGQYRLKLYKNGNQLVFTEIFQIGPGSPNDIRLVLEP